MSSASRKKADLEARKINSVINAEMKRAYDQGVNAGCAKTLILMNYILRNKFGFGKKRFHRIYDEAKYLGECVDEGRLSLDDMHQVLIDECDMDIYKEMV